MRRILSIGASKWNIPAWQRRLQSQLEHPRYVLVVAAIAAVNAFLPFFPVELFVILRVLRRPKEWWRLAVLAAAASAVGAVGLAHLVNHQTHSELASWLALRVGQANWESVSQLVQRHGSVGLTLISVSFLPLPPAVVLCAWSKVPDWEIALSIGIGNCLKYGFFSWLAAYSPRWLSKAVPSPVSPPMTGP